MVSFFSNHGRSTAQVILRGRPGTTSTLAGPIGVGALAELAPELVPELAAGRGLGAPKSGAGVCAPTTGQLPNHLAVSAASSRGSTSPATMIAAFSGRYQRAWKAFTAASCAPSMVATGPMVEWSASGWPANSTSRLVSITRSTAPPFSRFSASTIGASVRMSASLSVGAIIMPDSRRKLSSRLAGVASGRSMLNTVWIGVVSALVSVPKVAPSRCQVGMACAGPR